MAKIFCGNNGKIGSSRGTSCSIQKAYASLPVIRRLKPLLRKIRSLTRAVALGGRSRSRREGVTEEIVMSSKKGNHEQILIRQLDAICDEIMADAGQLLSGIDKYVRLTAILADATIHDEIRTLRVISRHLKEKTSSLKFSTTPNIFPFNSFGESHYKDAKNSLNAFSSLAHYIAIAKNTEIVSEEKEIQKYLDKWTGGGGSRRFDDDWPQFERQLACYVCSLLKRKHADKLDELHYTLLGSYTLARDNRCPEDLGDRLYGYYKILACIPKGLKSVMA
jgi:hypothetical protein